MADTDNSTTSEARWRNYQHLIWTQQQIHMQIQQQQQQPQQMQNQKMNSDSVDNRLDGINNHGLQPVPMQEKSLEEKPAKGEGTDPWDNFDAQAAFLGPTLWDKRLPYDGQDFKLEYVDLEEFLKENGIPLESSNENGHYKNGHQPPTNGNGMAVDQVSSPECSPPVSHAGGPFGPGPSRNQGHNIPNQNLMRGPSSLNQSENSRSPSPCGSSISMSSDDSSSSETHDLQRNPDLDVESIPGHRFDPRTRIFTEDELKPQPMIKKSKKQFVPELQKDAKYWARRRKNNMAAKRSRDARRVKENQIAMRACFLEKENSILKEEIDRIQKENMMLKEQLNGCR